MKYLIETFGCQMNLHDSERMAGLLEQAGFEATDDDRDADVIVINTCSVRERAEEKLYTRLGEIRQMGEETGSGPSSRSPAASRSRKARRSSSGRRPCRRHHRHAEPEAAADARRRGGGAPGTRDASRAPGRSRSTRSTTSRSRSGSRGAAIRSRPTSRSSKAATSSARSASSRTRAATSGCGRRPTSSPTSGTRPTPARRKSSCSARSSTTTRRPTSRRATSRRCSSGSTTSPGIERIRFASPHPRHVTPRMIEAMRDLPKVCRHLHLPVQSGSTRVLAGDAAAAHARGISRARRPACARPCRTSRYRPI